MTSIQPPQVASCKQTLFYFSVRSFQKRRQASENDRGAQEKKKERMSVDIFGEKEIYINVLSLSPPRSQYQLNWANKNRDINCLCNWLKYFTLKQQWHSKSRVC